MTLGQGQGLTPWTRAPWLGLRSPAAFVAVLVTTAILACAVASAPLFLSAARSAALQAQLSDQCPEAGWLQTGVVSRDNDAAAVFQRAWAQQGRTSDEVLSTAVLADTDGGLRKGPGPGLEVIAADGTAAAEPLSLFYRRDALQHIQVESRISGKGLWLPTGFARTAHIALGDEITVAEEQVQVVGLYRDLYNVAAGRYWCDYRSLYANDTNANTGPPAWGIVTDPQTFYRLGSDDPFSTITQVRVPAGALTTTGARALVAAQDRAGAQALAQESSALTDPIHNPRLLAAVRHAEQLEHGLRGPVVPVAVAGGLLALLLLGAAGSFWADRRATELRLLTARGVGPGPLAGKATLELALPALTGAALGWSAAQLLVTTAGPANDLDPSATSSAGWASSAALVAGLTAAALAAGLRARATAERPIGASRHWTTRAPWELALLAAAVWCWSLLREQQAVSTQGGVAQVDGLLVAFPLLGIAGAAVVVARALIALLPRLRRWAGSRSPAIFLALNRLAAARLATAALLVAVTVPIAVLGYTATLTSSSEDTLHAKVGVQIGATRAVTSFTRLDGTPAIDAAGTFVVRYNGTVESARGAEGGSTDVQVLAVDPADFAATAYWDPSFADASLQQLMTALRGPAVDGRIPVVATGVGGGDPHLRLGRQPVAAQVVATARVLPGRREDEPVVLVAVDRLPDVPRSAVAGRVAELWTNGPMSTAVDAVAAAGGRVTQQIDPDLVQSNANFLGITWTFGYLSALAVFVGVIAVGGLLLYLEGRSRGRVPGYVMTRRLGLSRGAHLRSLAVELAGVAVTGLLIGGLLAAAAVALVYRRLDVDLLRPPTELLDVPVPALGWSAAVTLAVALLACVSAQAAADRSDPATVLRQEA